MIIGVSKELKTDEKKVDLTPAGIKTFINSGYEILIQRSAGEGSGF